MQLNTVVCLAAIIMNITFLTEKACARLGIRPFALCFPALCALALSDISFRPAGEVSFDASVLAVPACFMLLCSSGGANSKRGKAELGRLAAVCLLPVFVSALFSCMGFVYDGYAVFEFREESLIPWQFLLCAMDIGLMDILMAKRAKAL